MARYVILLHGINVGAANRIAMPALRQALTQTGLRDVKTYRQSGNIVASHDVASPAALATEIEQLITHRFSLKVPALVVTARQLAQVVDRNPFPDAAREDPKHYQVTFLSAEPDREMLAVVSELATDRERLAAHGRALYALHPAGIHSSKLAAALTPRKLGVDVATARNWATVSALVEMVNDAV